MFKVWFRFPNLKFVISSGAFGLSNSNKVHLEIAVDEYGISVPALYLFAVYFMLDLTEETMRGVTISNLEVYEKFDHIVKDEWFGPYKEGAESRLSSTSLQTKLKVKSFLVVSHDST